MKFVFRFIRRGIFIFCFGAILLALNSNPSNAQETPPPPVPAQQQDTTPPAPAPQVPTTSATPVPVTFEITGSARSGKTPLPGVTVTAANTLTGKKYLAATSSEGKFSLSGLARGRYVVRIEFMGFAAFTQEVVLNPENPAGKVDAELMLASRQQEQSNNALAALAAAGRGFQSLAMENSLSSLGGTNGDGGALFGNGGVQNNGDVGGLPLNGAGAEGPTESVSVSGAQGRTQDFGMGNEEELQQRIQEFRDRMQREGGGAFGPPGGGGFGGGPGIISSTGSFLSRIFGGGGDKDKKEPDGKSNPNGAKYDPNRPPNATGQGVEPVTEVKSDDKKKNPLKKIFGIFGGKKKPEPGKPDPGQPKTNPNPE